MAAGSEVTVGLYQLARVAVVALFGLAAGCAPPGSRDPSVTSMAVPDDQVLILAKGWDKAEIDRILSDFETKYDLRAAALQSEDATGAFRIRLRQPMGADQLLFLINYIHYPEGFDLEGKTVAAAARVRLSDAFGITTSPLLDKIATFYIPSNDREYDEVYAEVDSGSYYRLSFTDLAWEPVADARQSRTVISLRGGMALPLNGREQSSQ
jgi:hypothetical protein